MNAWAPVCIEALKMRMDACVQMLEHHRKDIISVNEDAVEFKKDNGSIHRFHIRSLLTNSPAERSPLNFVDCDFCKSIINNGADLLYIYTKMQLSPIRNKYITFTFSCRTAGDERTIEWLAKNFPELDIPRNYVFINDTRCKEIGYRQYVKRMYDPTRDRFLDIYKYRDSGDNMITGLIKIL